MKELPRVFRNSINKEINNNKTYSYEKSDDRIIETDNIDIKMKIKEIFNSPNYVYKALVEVKTKKGTVTKQVIGHNKEYLLTLDDDKILIDDIVDIRLK